jgi:hypothetical protein
MASARATHQLRFKRQRRILARCVRVLAASSLLALSVAVPGVTHAAPPSPELEPAETQAAVPTLLLPDLRTVAPNDLTVEYGRGGRRLLRLANMVWNSGEGALELVGELNPSTQETIVVQQLDLLDTEDIHQYVVGEFVYHPTHAHFHLEQFAQYQVWSMTPDGELHSLVASGEKLSYCLMETNIVDNTNPSFTRRRTHTDCGQEAQGILPGWGDRYNAELDGQTVDITHLSNGTYALLSTANPTGALLETDYTNNTGVSIIALRNMRVTILSQPPTVPEHCRATGRC